MVNKKKSEKFVSSDSAIAAYEALLKEAAELKDNMQKLMLKYEQTLNILASTQRKNVELQKQVSIHQAREAALLGHIKSNLVSMLVENSREKIDERLIN